MCDSVFQLVELIKLRLLEDWRVQCGISISSMTVSIVVVILVLTTHHSISDTAFKTQVVEEEIAPIQFEPVCVDCAKLSKDHFSGYFNDPIFRKLHIEIRDGHLQCCIKDTDQMAILVNIMLKDTLASDPTLSEKDENHSSQPTAAHKNMIGTVERDREFPREHAFLRFDVNNTPSEHSNGVDVTPLGLRIIHSGMYYLYSSINFTLRKQAWEPSSLSTSVHLSRPRSPADNGELLKSTHTGGQRIQETVFTGGVFHLQAGDLIQVCVSGRDIVNFKSDSTFTGLMMLATPVAATSTVKK